MIAGLTGSRRSRPTSDSLFATPFSLAYARQWTFPDGATRSSPSVASADTRERKVRIIPLDRWIPRS